MNMSKNPAPRANAGSRANREVDLRTTDSAKPRRRQPLAHAIALANVGRAFG